ncbi:MAG: phosphoethanolamine transferase [Saccharospirillaceae bacterium]|nr:phosphoethanolamine transferase [Saccharospirillaceae bacterium]MCD8530739.1 phosphoethanolamine transferase [Saccharospirillaceae bacterium]
MSALFPLIPVKLLFIGLTVYIWTQLIRRGTVLNQPRASRFMFAFALLSVVLSVISVGKIYPYGAVTDLLIFAAATSLFMALPMRSLAGRFSGFLIIALPLLGPLTYLLHYQVVGGAMNKDSFIAVFQTTRAEAGEYLASFTSVMSIIPLLLAIALLVWIVKHNVGNERKVLPVKTATTYFLLSILMIALAPLEKGLFTYPVDVYVSYQKEMATTKERMAQFSERNIKKDYRISKEGEGEVYVVVVGESLNKHHMGVYGYELDTTPNLQRLKDEGNLFIADNSFSNYPGTMAALSHALTAANQKNNTSYTESPGIVELMNEAGFMTHWLGNQPLSNSYDMILGLIAKEAQDVQLTFDIEFHSMSHKNHQPDGVLLPLYKDILAQRDAGKNQAIFVHLMGNHTDYCERYPEAFKRYEVSAMDALYSHIFKGGLGHSRECYDNSILYNDYVVSTLIGELQNALGENGIGGLLYFADHSEDIERGVGHSSANFSYDMVESPALIWLSPAYQQIQTNQTAALRHNLSQYYPNDFIFDTVIGMTGTQMEGSHYCNSCDLFSFAYDLPAENARTMHGKLAYKPLKDASPAAITVAEH